MPTVATQTFPTLMSSLLWLSLLHATWIGLVIAACVAWLFQARGKISHRVRHDVLVLSLGLVAVVPVVFAAMQTAATTSPSEATSLGRAISFVVRSRGEFGADSGLAGFSKPSGGNDSDSYSSSLRILEAIAGSGGGVDASVASLRPGLVGSGVPGRNPDSRVQPQRDEPVDARFRGGGRARDRSRRATRPHSPPGSDPIWSEFIPHSISPVSAGCSGRRSSCRNPG